MISDSSVASIDPRTLGVSQRCSSQAFSPAGRLSQAHLHRLLGIRVDGHGAVHASGRGGASIPLGEGRLLAYGIAQFLAIVGGLGFVLAADAYRARPRIVRGYALVLLPLALVWPCAARAEISGSLWSRSPAHCRGAGGRGNRASLDPPPGTAARRAGRRGHVHRNCRDPSVGTIGANASQEVSRLTFIDVALNLVAALGMQLMAFEDMTYELRMTNMHLAAVRTSFDTVTTIADRLSQPELLRRGDWP